MNFRRTRAPGRWRVSLAFIVLHVFFAVRASLPQLVICHKAGGGSAVEFDTADGCCQCQECEHCRARRLAPRPGSAVPALEACHCQHELILSDVGHSSLRLPDRHPLFDPASAPAEHGVEPIFLPLRARLLIEAYSGRSSGPTDSAFALLRC